MTTWRFVGINFDHMHMPTLLEHVHDHPNAEIVGVCDERPERMRGVIDTFSIPPDRVFTDYRKCLEATKADVAILCPATGLHAEYTEKVAPFGVHILMEKPFAATLAEADRMIAAVQKTGKRLAINWPLRWVASHVTTKRLIDEGTIGDVHEVHYYDGNRGPARPPADRPETPEEEAARHAKSWFYQKSQGGGSLLDYLGYGVTLGTWFNGGQVPTEVTSAWHVRSGREVDEHSVTVARYAHGLSKFETRWGTFTNPWQMQPQPKCGFVVKGSAGTIASYDYEQTVRVQTKERPEGFDVPVDELEISDPVQYLIDRLEAGAEIDGPLSPKIARIGQQIVDSAVKSTEEKRTVRLLS
jgi:glucose-fructose oxidoreductase